MDAKDKEIQQKIVERGNLPVHVAIIMDGNGRWAENRGLDRIEGHKAGRESVRDIVRASAELGVKILTLYAFSIENWNRPPREVFALMGLLRETLREEIDELNSNNVKLITIGRTEQLPRPNRTALLKAIQKTSQNTGLILNLALNYSGRVEIVDALRKITHEVKRGLYEPEAINEKVIYSHLYTTDLPDPDLLIRTSGEMRLSNFLLWQLAYSEIWVTDVLWPDFRREHFYQAIESYQSRERRFGKTSAQLRGMIGYKL